MRVRASGDSKLENYDNWTLSVGNGTTNDVNGLLHIPEDMFYRIKPNTSSDTKVEERSMIEFCKMVFPDFTNNFSNTQWLNGRSMLAPTNSEVDTLNDLIQTWIPGAGVQLASSDTLENYQDIMRFNIEYLNTLCPTGFPRHLLSLKPGMPIMLLRNICPNEGLCNGTKLIYLRNLSNRLLECKVVSTGKIVLLPRIKLIPNPGTNCFDWARRQFPIRTAFATTINKAQGQTLKRVGVWLRSPVFGHGQLYVASSRTGNPDALKFAVKQQEGEPIGSTTNVVYNEVLLQ